ncbi:solute carrier organic anion transporter family member 4A1-like [Tigriopus californicus]|uniref:solute carrier organic anion transporter family member 4A1-like n=1 Tax=Tigriopus californicus TaxID=6832 RepID=UPI0027DA3105|nr:solute carrier organic anion transporter family member 4A1-like [Tigriopus californicus]XP_059079707.1 solute carrier organic anion transporter family member 4A1-like [Tigriopus californicus]XP_059079708.1 solute carrier organic anion transporter family member 4A1-like [Tigriopus californicus]
MDLADIAEGGITNPAFLDPQESPKGRKKVDRFGIAENRVQPTTIEDVVEEENQLIKNNCNLFRLIPLPCFRIFLKPQWILVFLCWASTIQGMVVNGCVNVVISTIEKRFGLQSALSGLIAGSYDIGSMLAVIPVTYFGGRLGSSKPRYISSGLLLMGLGSLVFALPHFLTDRYEFEVDADGLANPLDFCTPGDKDTGKCDAKKFVSDLSNFKYFFLLGQFLHGVGAAPLITLGTTLLDDSVSKKSSPLYIGIFQTMFVIGPAIGFIMGGHFLGSYTDFDVLDSDEVIQITAQSPLWIGAWWVGFVIAWVCAWSCALFLGCYPGVLPGSEHHNEVKDSDGFSTLKQLPKAIYVLLTNPTYMFINLGSAMDGFSIAGASTFLPKFMQYQYGLSPGLAAMVVGLIVVPCGGGGTFIGGYITKRLKLTRSGVIRMFLMAQSINVPCILAFFFYCDNPQFTGITVPYSKTDSLDGSLLDSCNQDCHCLDFKFNPVCGSDGQTYFSPCHAGCIDSTVSTGQITNYTSCACVNGDNPMVFKTPCSPGCNSMIGFIVVISLSMFCTFMAAMPNVVATLRSVEPVHRSLALGIESIVSRVLGTIPGPVILGSIIDYACLLWEKRECHEDAGSCQFYDNYSMAMAMFLALVVVKILSVVAFAFALFFSQRSHIKDEVD